MAYISNLQFLPLDEILLSNGYKHKVEKSSKNNAKITRLFTMSTIPLKAHLLFQESLMGVIIISTLIMMKIKARLSPFVKIVG